MTTIEQEDRITPGYEASGRQDEDLAFAVRRISEFAQKYKRERDEYRAMVWAWEQRVSELQQEIAILRQQPR